MVRGNPNTDVLNSSCRPLLGSKLVTVFLFSPSNCDIGWVWSPLLWWAIGGWGDSLPFLASWFPVLVEFGVKLSLAPKPVYLPLYRNQYIPPIGDSELSGTVTETRQQKREGLHLSFDWRGDSTQGKCNFRKQKGRGTPQGSFRPHNSGSGCSGICLPWTQCESVWNVCLCSPIF
jgi:hypothetical protein